MKQSSTLVAGWQSWLIKFGEQITRKIFTRVLSLFWNLSLFVVHIHLNRKQISQWDFTLFSRVQKFQKKEKRRNIGAEIKAQKSLFNKDPFEQGGPISQHQCIRSSELTLFGNPFFSRTVKVSMEFWSLGRLSILVPFLASFRWCRVRSQSLDCSRRKQFSSSSIITLSWNLWNDHC